MKDIRAIRLAGFVCLGLVMFVSDSARADECAGFAPLPEDIVDMAFIRHDVYDDPGLGASVKYSGPDGTLTYYRFDLGYDQISQPILDEATRLAAQDIETVIHMLNGKVIKVLSSGQERIVGDVVLSDIIVVADVSGAAKFDFLATGTDGRCLHKVRYTPNVVDLDDQGRNGDGLVVIERFNRVLDGLTPYFDD